MARRPDTGMTSDQARHLAEELRTYRARFGTTTEMARAWGISQPQLSQLLAGKGTGAGVSVLCRIRKHTGKTIDELLGLPPLGPSLDVRVRALVTRAIDDLAKERTPELPPPHSPRLLPRPRPKKES